MPYKDPLLQKQAKHRSYLRNKEKIISNNQKTRNERYTWYKEFMKGKSCACCSETAQECLDWHHIDPSTKEGSISQFVKDGKLFETIFKEMKKCVVVCANCHRKIHAGTLSCPP